MNIGMLWFDKDPQTNLVKKVEKAAAYYHSKYGVSPTICYVHPSMVGDTAAHAKDVVIKTNQLVLPHHFWIGVNGAKPKQTA